MTAALYSGRICRRGYAFVGGCSGGPLGPLFSLLSDLCVSVPLCVKSFSESFSTTHHPPLTTHEPHP